MHSTTDRYVVRMDEDRRLGFGDELGDAIAWAHDARASGRSAEVWRGTSDTDDEPRRVWPRPDLTPVTAPSTSLGLRS